ncbi:NAD(P)-dependent oxidoreductase [Vibrio sp. S11_S32]|uniref:NAD-dependent epimerase/dehydratase family protein n=1 Tax=Vibrio sp. S11_S32 TaxID=2720225 RepID=UPI001680599A|nr:NAD-dependent epimerase/dehydratase family protein [Vibrio sp. S11_S32]MBD1578034.1 NAD(P)-dependent oxidoreductase [Vibrio sp. S11_S32]
MKLLVAGSNGYVGSHVTDFFRDKGFDVFVYSREEDQDHKGTISSVNVEMHGFFDAVINCARPHWSMYTPENIAQIETDLLSDLNKFASKNATKIHTSGIWLFGNANEKELRHLIHRPFDMVKLDEKTIQNSLSLNWNVVYCPSLIYGGNSCQLRRIVGDWGKSPVTVAIPSVGYNQYVHVLDVAEFYYTLVTQPNIKEKKHIIAETKGYTPETFAKLLQENSIIECVSKVNWDEFELQKGLEAIDIEKLNLNLPISSYFREKHTINEYLMQYT